MDIPNYLLINTATTAELRQATKDCFEDRIIEAHLLAGRRYGPFYRVDQDRFVLIGTEGLRINPSAIMYARTDALMGFIHDCPESVTDRADFESFLLTHREAIETDTNFIFLQNAYEFFKPKYRDQIKKIYDEVAPGRWVGLEMPKDFCEANSLYNIPFRRNQKLHLYELYIVIPNSSGGFEPTIFLGKASSGTGVQGRLNNHAVNCISDINEIKRAEWPWVPKETK